MAVVTKVKAFNRTRLCDKIVELAQLMRSFGISRAIRIFWRLHSIFGKADICLPKELVTSTELFLRKRESDPEVFTQVFIEEQYKFAWLENSLPRIIVDAGANVGLSALYFHERFPNARIIAIEPGKQNFSILLQNTRSCQNISAIEGAVWSRDELVTIENPLAVGCVLQVGPSKSKAGEVRAWSVPTLMSEHEIGFIDLLKIDIEGAERELFNADTAWMKYVRVIVIELHDHTKPGCAQALHRSLAPFTYRMHVSGESLVITFPEHVP